MSQKPRTGGPARPASAFRAVPKEVVTKTDPAAAEADVPMESVPMQTGPMEPVSSETDPVQTDPVDPIAIASADAIPPPAMEAEPDAPGVPSFSVDETISAASDLAAASAEAVSATITATVDTVAAVTSEVAETAASIEPTQPTVTRGIKSMIKSTEDFVAFGQANLEAFVKSGQIWSAGVQELTKQIASSAKASFDESVSTFKAMSTAKSVKEAIDLQSSFAKAALEKAMAESNKLTDASIKLTEQTLAPITARVTVAVETFGKAA
jgi:phasin family protein